MKRSFARVVLAVFLLAWLAPAPPAAAAAQPKLLLFITVDQLRGDMPLRFRERFGDGGFRRLMEQGVYYTNAHYRHATTFTAVGHATLATGGNGGQHGMAGNDWYDFATGRQVYCVEDDRHHVLGREPKAHEGASPRNLTSSTIGDELIVAAAGRSRVFSVSLKDRGAILPGGHLGKAFWYDGKSGRFVTSSYYYGSYPKWVAKWNDRAPALRYKGKSWDLLQPRETYLYGEQDDLPSERPYKKLGRTFPHPLDGESDADLFSTLPYTPMGDELTLDFVRALVRHEKIGQGDATDMLAVSFSATDYIGHAFGPSTLEAEDNLLRLDRTLARLFSLIDQTVGRDRTLIVLSSDHGIDESPEARHDLACTPDRLAPDYVPRSALDRMLQRAAASGGGGVQLCCGAGRHFPDTFLARANAALKERFGVEADLVTAFWNPCLYLDLAAVKQAKLNIADVESVLAETMQTVPGIARAVTRTDLLAGAVTDDPVMSKVQRAFHPTRSGNVFIVQSPFWYLYPKATEFAAMHGSPYSYDTYVPIMFAGPGIRPRWIDRRVGPEDIAPTLARRLGINPPSGATGDVLGEVLR